MGSLTLKMIKQHIVKAIAGVFSFLMVVSVQANPVLDNIGSGEVTLDRSPNTLTINQTTDKAILNWRTFNIDATEATHFNQPRDGIAFNRINAANGASQIYGSLSATGQIILLNPAGIYFGPTARVNVGGLIASTGSMTDASFLSGHYNITNVSDGVISNRGQIIAKENGLVALLGNNISNEGLIQANLGKVILASGDTFTLSFSGDDLVSFAVNNSPKSINNTGTLSANGGQIIVSAKTVSGVIDNVINMQGIAEAKSVGIQNGEIILDGGTSGIVAVKGKLIASGKNAGEQGGHVQITGHNILIDNTAEIDVSGDAGGGLVEVGGNARGLGLLQHANAIYMAQNAIINADAITSGNGGNIVLWSDYSTRAYGSLYARGGSLSGNGGLIETSSAHFLNVNPLNVSTLAAHGSAGTWLLDPTDLTISNAPDNNVSGSSPFQPTGGSSNLSVATLISALNGGNVTVESNGLPFGAPGELGDLTVADPITWSSANGLILSAWHDININASIQNTAVSVTPGDSWLSLSATHNININSGLTWQSNAFLNLQTNSGDININGVINNGGGIGSTFLLAGPLSSSIYNITYGVGGNLITNGLNLAGGNAQGFNSSNTTVNGGFSSSPGTTFTTNGDFIVGGFITINGLFAPSADTTLTGTNIDIASISGIGSPSITLVQTGGGFIGHVGPINGVNNVTITNNNGRMFFTDNNVYSGTTTINPNSSLWISALTTTGNLGTGDVIDNGELVFERSDSLTVSNNINGFGAVTKRGGGVLTLTGTNTYSGQTNIFDGALQVGDGNTTGTLGTGNVTNNTSLIFNRSDALAIANNISGTGSITQAGTGGTTISGNNSYSGATNINAGTLFIANNHGLGNSSGVTVASGATLDLVGVDITTLIPLTLNGTGANGLGALQDVDSSYAGDILLATDSSIGVNSPDTLTLTGVISGPGQLTKVGTGTLALTNANTYTGGTVFNDPGFFPGTISVGNNNALGTGTITVADSNTANLEASQSDIVLSNPLTIANSARLNIQGANNLELSGNISMQLFFSSLYNYNAAKTVLSGFIDSNFSNLASIHQEGPGELELVNSNNGPIVPFFPSYSGSIILNAGTLTADSGFAMGRGTFVYNNGQFQVLNDSGSFFNMFLASTLTYNSARLSMRGNVSGPGGLVINGGGISLGGFSSFTGGAIINGGFLETSNGNAGTGSVTVNAGGGFNVFSTGISNPIILNGGTMDGSSNGSPTSVSGPITLLADSTITSGQSGITTFNINGPIDGAFALSLSGSGVFSLNNIIGGTTPLTTLTATANQIQLNNASIFTTGDQQYNNPIYENPVIAMPGTSNNLTLVGNANANINFAFGATGGGDLTILGNTGDNLFSISNNLLVHNLSIDGAGGNDTLALLIPSAQTWSVTDLNTGTIANAGITGIGTFNNIQNVISGSGNDIFAFSGTGAFSGLLDTAGGFDLVDYSAYLNAISVIMSDPSTGTGNTYRTATTVADPASAITAFTHVDSVTGNNGGFFTVPLAKQFALVFTSQTPFNSQYFSGAGFVLDPINFQQFLFQLSPTTPSVIPNVSNVIYPYFNTNFVYALHTFPPIIDTTGLYPFMGPYPFMQPFILYNLCGS